MLRKTSVDTLATIVLATCAVAVTLMLGWKQFRPPPDPSGLPPRSALPNWREYVAGQERLGPATAPVTMVEFSDFQCPFCQRLFETLAHVQARHPNDVAIVYRNFPLEQIHPYARGAAIAAVCAGEQGRFANYYDYLFQHQALLGQQSWPTIAHSVGVPDTSRFARCLQGPAVVQTLHIDSVAAAKLNVTGTPTLVINGWLLRGAPPEDSVEALVRQELSAAKAN